MTQLVAITHPITGKTYNMHPDLAAQQHHWVHPDPCVPTPEASLPLFNLDELDRMFARLAAQPITHPAHHPTTAAAGVLENGVLNVS